MIDTNISKLTNNYIICPWCQGSLARGQCDTCMVCQNCKSEYWSYTIYLYNVISDKMVKIEFLKDRRLKYDINTNKEDRVWIDVDYNNDIEFEYNIFDDPKTFKNKLRTILAFI